MSQQSEEAVVEQAKKILRPVKPRPQRTKFLSMRLTDGEARRWGRLAGAVPMGRWVRRMVRVALRKEGMLS